MSRLDQQAYRARLKKAGRKEILVDLPESLVSMLDARKSSNVRRSHIVEQLLRQALAAEPNEAV